jgi:DNA-binding CsgD family transcriptional regulator
MSDGAQEELGSGVIFLSADVAAGEAVASACARRGLDVTVAEIGRADAVRAEVVLIDFRSDRAVMFRDLSEMRGNGVRRVIAIGEPSSRPSITHLDAWVGLDAGIDELVAAITGSVRSRPGLGAEAKSDLERLTPREREVMALLLTGCGSDAIGTRLGIAPNTVRTHLQNVFSKLGVSSRAEAAAWALRAGIESTDVTPEAAT